MCQVLEITYTSFGITGDWVIQVPGVNYDGTYYEYYFNTQFNPTAPGFQTAEWRIIRNAGIPEWELQILTGGTLWVTTGTAPDGECPTGPWITPGTELIDILSVTEYDLGHTCTAWYSWPSNTGLSSTCGYWDSAIHQINPELEDLLEVGQFLEYYTDLFGESAEDTGSFQDEFQGARILALVYLLPDGSISFNKCDGGTFIGVLLQDSNNNLVRHETCTRFSFTETSTGSVEIFEWTGNYFNCRKEFTFDTTVFPGLPLIRLRVRFYDDVGTNFPVSVAPIGTPGWVFEQEDPLDSDNWTPFGFIFEDTMCPEGLVLENFTGTSRRLVFEDITPIETGVICLCYEEPVDDCYDLLVWDKQCEFAKCTSTYLNHLLFGSYDNKELENLKEQRRILEILNCYDSRDIENNTTIYNNFTYSKIKKLLS